MRSHEASRFMASEMTAILGTINPGGHPHMVPMWYIMREDAPAFWTYKTSQKVKNLRRDARASCLVEAGSSYEELRGVLLHGAADIEDDQQSVIQFGTRLYSKYYPELSEHEARERAEDSGNKRVIVTLDVVDSISWDHRKLSSDDE